MLGVYLLAALIGGGLLLFSLLTGDQDGTDVEPADVDLDAGDLDVGDGDGAASDADADFHDSSAAALLLGFFRPRNFIFFAAAFGLTGLLLTWLGSPQGTTFGLSLAMGGGAFLLTHAIFTWLRTSDLAVDAISDDELEGRIGRIILPVGPGERGRIVTEIADRELYLTARISGDESRTLPVGGEVVILGVEDGVAEVIAFDSLELPPSQNS